MTTISLRLSDSDAKLLKEYTLANNLSVSSFIRDTIIDKIEDDLKLDEERILNAQKRIGKEEMSDHTEVWKRLGV